MNIYEKLTAIQKSLKAPKNATNDYGKYSYRTIDSINEALKPLLDKNKASLVLTDSVEPIGNRFYVKATATLIDNESENFSSISSSAFAREPDLKKGTDESQITGTASTYARKYALTGLFLLDNSENDPDKTNGAPVKCAACNKVIKDENLIEATMNRYKKPICLDCINKKKAELQKKEDETKKKAQKPADVPDAELPFPI